MRLSAEKLAVEAESTGFRPDVLEKVAHLLGLLDTLQSHPFLKGKSAMWPFNDAEREFLDLLLDKGEIDSTILTTDVTLQKRIQRQPLLEWKALNVRRYKGFS